MTSPVICLMGPTASGKTMLSLRLCELMKTPIISVDSALIYRGMDIGTAKPSSSIRARFPHYLIDIREPNESYSAGAFCSDANSLIDQQLADHKVPLLVGGTMMYFNALQKGIAQMPHVDEGVRESLETRAANGELPQLYARLQQVDPVAAQKIKPTDPQRIVRALAVFDVSGVPLSQWWQQQPVARSDLSFINIALAPTDRALLHQRISDRFTQMLSQGFIDEVRALIARGDLNAQLPSIRSVGYRQAWAYLQGEMSFDEMVQKAVTATRQLAKRQLTWLRHWPDVTWFDSDVPDLEVRVLTHLEERGVC